jgi:hypothetical protein
MHGSVVEQLKNQKTTSLPEFNFQSNAALKKEIPIRQ